MNCESRVGDHVVAMGAFRRSGPERAKIKRMRVHPLHQRRGYGRLILARLEARAIELGYSRLHLDTTVGQQAARRLYQRHGFEEVGRGRLGAFELVLLEKNISGVRQNAQDLGAAPPAR